MGTDVFAEAVAAAGLDARELETLLRAVGRSETNRRNILILARACVEGYSGRIRINMKQGNIVEGEIETSFEALTRLLDPKAGQGLK